MSTPLLESIQSPADLRRLPRAQLKGLADEWRRSLSYYEKNHEFKGFGRLSLSGIYCDNEDLLALLQKEMGLPFAAVQMKDLLAGDTRHSGLQFEVALTLAMRGAEK